MLKRFLFVTAVIIGIAMLVSTPTQAATKADIIFLVDESGSMSTEHAWIPNMVLDLDSGLQAVVDTSNNAAPIDGRYGVVGFGSSNTLHALDQSAHKHLVGGNDFGTAAEIGTSLNPAFVNSGSIEDGYDAINFALTQYTFRSDAAINLVLITDEDRDTNYYAGTYNNILTELNAKNALLNVVVNCTFNSDSYNSVIGIDFLNNAYVADGSGGFFTDTGGTAVSGHGTTITDYVNLGLATGAAAWDLNQLRAGGNTATSFTNAFVEIKVEEIEGHSVPEPATMLLLGSGLIGLAGFRRKKNLKK